MREEVDDADVCIDLSLCQEHMFELTTLLSQVRCLPSPLPSEASLYEV